MTDGAKPVVRRSRAGCSECRRRRRRCDEKKPACSYCVSTEQQCKYVVKLSWGGRPFSRSIFGQCLDVDDGVAKIGTEVQTTSRQPFVYGTKSQQKNPKRLRQNQSGAIFVSAPGVATEKDAESEDALDQKIEFVTTSQKDLAVMNSALSRASSPRLDTYKIPEYAWISPHYRDLLGYFTERMTRSISCYNVVQTQYCSALLPMATGSPHLLAAVLYLAACHKTSRGLEQSASETDRLRASSLRQLRLSIAAPETSLSLETAIASTLTLCIADIVSDVAVPGSWRIHMQGALSLWGQMIRDPSFKSRKESANVKFLKRWYISFETIAFSCGIIPVRRFMSNVEEDIRDEDNYIDDITSFSTLLLPIFEEMNNIKTNQEMNISGIDPRLIEIRSDDEVLEDTQDTCQILIHRVQHLLATRTPRFRSSVSPLIPEEVKKDYFGLDEAYHHMALLQIYILSTRPIEAGIVRASVIRIIDGCSNLKFIDDACPAVAILPPLFTAGSQAWAVEDQDRILDILARMEECWGMGNVRGSRDLLRRVWTAQGQRGGEKGPFRWEVAIGETWDMLPY